VEETEISEKLRQRRERQGGEEDREGEGNEAHTSEGKLLETRSGQTQVVQQQHVVVQMRKRREKRERRRRRRDARRKNSEVSLFAVFITTISSRALNSHQNILYLM
jgi:hypothetical protein